MPRAISAFRQTSTAISDAALAASCIYAAQISHTHSLIGAIGFLSVAAAASAGVARYDQNDLVDHQAAFSPQSPWFGGFREAIRPHEFLTFFASSGALLFLALAFYFDPRSSSTPPLIGMIGGVLLAFAMFVSISSKRESVKDVVPLVCGFVFMGVGGYTCYLKNLWIGLFGIILFGVIGMIGTKGQLAGFKKVDVFHYSLAASLLMIAQGLTQLWPINCSQV